MKTSKTMFKVCAASFALLLGMGYAINNQTTSAIHAENVKAETDNKLITDRTVWNYLDTNVDPGTKNDRYAWTKSGYDTSAWKQAAGKFGAKNGVLADLGGGITPTVLLKQYIGDTTECIPTYFFQTTINIQDIKNTEVLSGELLYDDAAIIYINGKKVAAYDEPVGGFNENMMYGGSNASSPKSAMIKLNQNQLKDVLVQGNNTLSVELHQGRSSSSDVYFEFKNLQIDKAASDITQKTLNLTVGENESQMNITWYANTDSQGIVQLVEAEAVKNNVFPANYKTIKAKSTLSNDPEFYTNQAVMSNLKKNTNYAYRIVNDQKISDIYYYKTGNKKNSFNFIFAGDPQVGASGNVANDTVGWGKTLADAEDKFHPDFLLSAGDQVNTASKETEYDGYLNHEEMTSMPQATTIGNHDSGSTSYSQHYNLPNVSDQGKTTAGADYSYVYNQTLFMVINTNNTSTAEHKQFMQEAIAKNADIRWKVVVFHQSIYSVASHAVETGILNLRQNLVPVFDELGIDVVLMGHDHVYVRSHIMKNLQVAQDTSTLSSVSDPDGIVYLTANSASGSKYYNIQNNINMDFVAKKDQSKQRSISNIEVSDNEFKIKTYLYDANANAWAELDNFSIKKSVETNTSELVLTPDVQPSIHTTVTAPIQSVEKGVTLNANDIKEGTVYDFLKTELKGSSFMALQVELMKYDQVSQPLSDVQVAFKLPNGYQEGMRLYRIQQNEETQLQLEAIAYEVKDQQIIVKTSQLGQFVFVSKTQAPLDKPDDDKKEPNKDSNQNASDKDNVQTSDATNATLLGSLLIVALGSMTLLIRRKSNKQWW